VVDLRLLDGDRGYDSKELSDELRRNSVVPLIKHRIYSSLDHAHNARMDRDSYHQRHMSETVFSSIKSTNGPAVRAQSCHLEFQEKVLKATVYNH